MADKDKTYDQAAEFAKGAKFTASSYDRTQKISVSAGLVTVGGKAGEAEITGAATGKGEGIEGTINLWLSIFRYSRPDGTVNHVAGWNIPLALKPGQTPELTAKALAAFINAGSRPYRATANDGDGRAVLSVVYTGEKL